MQLMKHFYTTGSLFVPLIKGDSPKDRGINRFGTITACYSGNGIIYMFENKRITGKKFFLRNGAKNSECKMINAEC